MKLRLTPGGLALAVGLALAGGATARPLPEMQRGTLTLPSATGRYVVTFVEPGLLRRGGVAARAPAGGQRKMEVASAEARVYAVQLDARRAQHVSTMETALGRPVEVRHSYAVYRNGVAVSMSAEEAARVAQLPGIESVKPVRRFEAGTYRGPKFIGSDGVWNGSVLPVGTGTRGEGVRIGVIDTGANSLHPSFANDASCGFSAQQPKLHAVDCNTSTGGVCDGPNPEAPYLGEDVLGHGVHTASTAGGNRIDASATPPPVLPQGVDMSGVAPCASVYSYKVANDADGGIYDDSIAAAIENLAIDAIDVANYSIGPGCGGSDPWFDLDDRAFLDALDADVFVAASAGNTREQCQDPTGKVSHVGPWLTSVAASTHDRQIAAARFDLVSPDVPEELRHIGVAPGDGVPLAEVPDASGLPLRAWPANIAGCSATGAFPPGYFEGSVALVRRGATPPATDACSFVEKIDNAAAAGARLVLIANDRQDMANMSTPGTTTPAFKINSLDISDALIGLVGARSGVPVEGRVFADGFDGATTVVADFRKAPALAPQPGDVLADFSFRGPTSEPYSRLTKPDVTAPGTDIYAAGRAQDGHYFRMSGTSMASPHVAGAAALLRALHPEWTVTEVKSALQTTAVAEGRKDDGITPWDADDVGSGRIDVASAARAGLTLDETYAHFLEADPAGGTLDLAALNLASMREPECAPECSWTRTVTNRLAGGGNWTVDVEGAAGVDVTVTPSSFALASVGATQVLTITAKPTRTLDGLVFGDVRLREAHGLAPDQRLSLVVGNRRGVGVDCADGQCELRLDALTIDYRTYGGPGAAYVWLNRFTPAPTDFPITIRSITTLVDMHAGGNDQGDLIPVHIYQDSDDDPANGATWVGSYAGYALPAPGPATAFTTIELPQPIVVQGPGNVLIALSNWKLAARDAERSATTDVGPSKGRSWMGWLYDEPAGAPPNLGESDIGLRPNAEWGIDGNWIIRASGTNASGKAIVLGADDAAGGR